MFLVYHPFFEIDEAYKKPCLFLFHVVKKCRCGLYKQRMKELKDQ